MKIKQYEVKISIESLEDKSKRLRARRAFVWASLVVQFLGCLLLMWLYSKTSEALGCFLLGLLLIDLLHFLFRMDLRLEETMKIDSFLEKCQK